MATEYAQHVDRTFATNSRCFPNNDPEQGQGHRGIHRHIRAVNESVSMQALLPTATPPVRFPRPSGPMPNQARGSYDLQQLEERLRVAYGPVEASLPTRLTELVERLARQEIPKD
jgi:hypothetical protein